MTSTLSTICSISLSVSLALGTSLGSGVAWAAPPEDAPGEGAEGDAPEGTDTGVSDEKKSEGEEYSAQAIEKFKAKDYDGAVELFQKAYEIDPQPNYLFNIGRVYEEAGNLEKAVEYYATFVKQAGVDIDSRGIALDRLKVLRAIIEETKGPAEVEPKDEEPKDEEPGETRPITPPPQPVDTAGEQRRKNMRISGFVLLGVGAGALIGGGVVGGLASGDNSSAAEAETIDDRRDLLASSKTKALTADILFGVGGALVLTGVILVAAGFAKPKTQRVALTPSFGPRGGGVDLRVSF